MVRVAILGSGVSGLGCAVKIKEKLQNVEVTVISKEFSPNTTGDGSAGLWYPYLCGDTSGDKLLKWGQETYQFIHKLWLEGLKGICAMPVYVLDEKKDKMEDPAWKGSVYGYHVMDKRHLEYLNDLHSAKYTAGACFTTFIAEPNFLLPYLMERFKAAGGKVVQAEITSLNSGVLKDFDVIVNCTGLGAQKLVRDTKMLPIRGQVTRVKAPWAYEIFINETSGNYIIPNVESCVLGGVHQEHNYNTSVDATDSRFIMDGCTRMVPSLVQAGVMSEWAGLRPGRECVRLEAEALSDRLVIHNYGHGGSGVTLFWGCAAEVLAILENHQVNTNKYRQNRQSKL